LLAAKRENKQQKKRTFDTTDFGRWELKPIAFKSKGTNVTAGRKKLYLSFI